MTDEKLAHLESISQLLIFQIKNINQLMAKAWVELELARSDLRELMAIYAEWEEERKSIYE